MIVILLQMTVLWAENIFEFLILFFFFLWNTYIVIYIFLFQCLRHVTYQYSFWSNLLVSKWLKIENSVKKIETPKYWRDDGDISSFFKEFSKHIPCVHNFFPWLIFLYTNSISPSDILLRSKNYEEHLVMFHKKLFIKIRYIN
jgi:hypothetical protein